MSNQFVGSVLSSGEGKETLSPPTKRETDPVSETLCFPVFTIPDDGHSPETH
jgi:hypothetical protein